MSDTEARKVPAEVERAWFTIARFVGIPGEAAARQLGVLGLASVAFVDADALGALREAVKPVRADVERQWEAWGTTCCPSVHATEIRTLFSAISTLTGTKHD